MKATFGNYLKKVFTIPKDLDFHGLALYWEKQRDNGPPWNYHVRLLFDKELFPKLVQLSFYCSVDIRAAVHQHSTLTILIHTLIISIIAAAFLLNSSTFLWTTQAVTNEENSKLCSIINLHWRQMTVDIKYFKDIILPHCHACKSDMDMAQGCHDGGRLQTKRWALSSGLRDGCDGVYLDLVQWALQASRGICTLYIQHFLSV